MSDNNVPTIEITNGDKSTQVDLKESADTLSKKSSLTSSSRKRKVTQYDDIRVPENLETKKRKLFNDNTLFDQSLSANPSSSTKEQSLLPSPLSTSPSTPLSTPPAYHFSTKNVDTTHVYVRSSGQQPSEDANDHLWEHDEDDDASAATTDTQQTQTENLTQSSSGGLQQLQQADITGDLLGIPNNAVGKVGIQLVKQINTRYVFEKFKDANIRNPIMSPGSIELHWDRRPERVLVVKQIHTDRTDKDFENVVKYLVNEKKVKVYVEPAVHEKLQYDFLETFHVDVYSDSQVCDTQSVATSTSGTTASTAASTASGYKNLHRLIDLIICLGGDGTILHTASMFPSAVPPILGFNLGSLGFLTAFDIHRYKEYINHVFNGSVYLSTRMRLTCKIRRSNGVVEPQRYQILNDIVVDRGQCPFLCTLDCFCNNSHITTVQADGLILATPTGSTAYSMSAGKYSILHCVPSTNYNVVGGSIVHPNVSCLLLTPICPHSLSFRPIILPDSTVLTIKIPQESRGTAWISFDGKNRQELQRGDSIIVTTSIWPVPLICKTEETSEWFMNLTDIFNWNKRERQKSFTSPDDVSSDDDTQQ